jgi:hypothetical protein
MNEIIIFFITTIVFTILLILVLKICGWFNNGPKIT